MWKHNWEETRKRFVEWWDRRGVMIGTWGAPCRGGPVHADVQAPAVPASLEERYCDPEFRARENRYRLSRSLYPRDVIPSAITDMGPGSLALLLGSTPGFAEDTVWAYPCMEGVEDPERLPRLRFDPGNRWWRVSEAVIRRCVQLAGADYVVGCPDLVENMDTLSALRGAQGLLVDMIERPAWVERKTAEINEAWFEAYQRIYELIKLDDGSSCYGAFYIWGPGKTAKVQCDSSAMFSPQMFERFVVPGLTAQCSGLDHSLYHLDGTQAMVHLDSLLRIESLDAIEWTPQAGIETGGNPRWYDLYRRILAAGKSVQAVNVRPEEVAPLLRAVGRHGIYILLELDPAQDPERQFDLAESAL